MSDYICPNTDCPKYGVLIPDWEAVDRRHVSGPIIGNCSECGAELEEFRESTE